MATRLPLWGTSHPFNVNSSHNPPSTHTHTQTDRESNSCFFYLQWINFHTLCRHPDTDPLYSSITSKITLSQHSLFPYLCFALRQHVKGNSIRNSELLARRAVLPTVTRVPRLDSTRLEFTLVFQPQEASGKLSFQNKKHNQTPTTSLLHWHKFSVLTQGCLTAWGRDLHPL